MTARDIQKSEQQLAEAILKHIASRADGVEAISYLHRALQEDGWRGLGPLRIFQSTVERLGFLVRWGKNDRGQNRTEVTL